MSIQKPVNENYSAIVVEVKSLIPLENANNIVHTNIFGNLVIVSKDISIGSRGLFFPVETKLLKEFLSNNNLYREKTLNVDKTKSGFFEENGRIRAVKLRGYPSMGFFIPLESLNFTKHSEKLKLGDCFDTINGIKICEKYVIVHQQNQIAKGNKEKHSTKKYKSKLVENQFRFHVDTTQLGKNLWMIKPDTQIQITSKWHGTSFISSKVLCKKNLNFVEKSLKKIGIKIQDTQYDYLYSSRSVIKNQNFINKEQQSFYKEDIWGIAHNEVKDSLIDGMTYYGEIVGFLSSGSYIQKDYDYKCLPGTHKVLIYRITLTNQSGQTIEFTTQQVQQWCKSHGLTPVHEFYYGRAGDVFPELSKILKGDDRDIQVWQDEFLKELRKKYLEKQCQFNDNKVPEEGIVIRVEDSMDLKVFKFKSFAFLEKETKALDKGEVDIEVQ